MDQLVAIFLSLDSDLTGVDDYTEFDVVNCGSAAWKCHYPPQSRYVYPSELRKG